MHGPPLTAFSHGSPAAVCSCSSQSGAQRPLSPFGGRKHSKPSVQRRSQGSPGRDGSGTSVEPSPPSGRLSPPLPPVETLPPVGRLPPLPVPPVVAPPVLVMPPDPPV